MKIKMLMDTGCEVNLPDGGTASIDVKKDQVVDATEAAAAHLIRAGQAVAATKEKK